MLKFFALKMVRFPANPHSTSIQLFLADYHKMLTNVNYAWMCASFKVEFLPVLPSLRISLEKPIYFILMVSGKSFKTNHF